MNLMRKLRGAPSASSSDSVEGSPGTSSHTQLGLMHLKKLFSEYTHPSHPLSDAEKDDKLYNMLPLFCKVFGSSPSSEMNEKFWDILAFCQQVSKLMVSEIRRRASNQSTEAASCAIAKFLEIENSEESSNGWMLLSTLNLLAAGDQSLIQVMTTASVPSTLVKCLYLFFDLPEMSEAEADTQDGGSDFTPRERRILLQKIFVQVLVRLCSHPFPCEELARKDDLSLLFSAITSWCPPYNTMWRKSAAEVLMTLSRHGLSKTVVQYIHNKGCVNLCIENMQRVPELSPLEVVEMFVAVFCFLKDSSDVSQLLLDDFRSCQGYLFLSEFLLKKSKQSIPDLLTGELEEERTRSAEGNAAIRNLVLMVASLCSCGYTELRPHHASASALFQLQGFILPQPTNRGQAVRNVQAFQVLQSVFLKSNSPALCCTILDAISSVYHADNANYFILEGQNTLSQFSEKIYLKNAEIQEKFFELLEFIVFQLNFVPCKELISLSILLKTNISRLCSILCMKTLLNVLRHNTVFRDVYREVGMLEVFVTCLSRYASFLSDLQILDETSKLESNKIEIPTSNSPTYKKDAELNENPMNIKKSLSMEKDNLKDSEEEELGSLIMEGLTLLLNGNASNCNVFRECGGAKCIHVMVTYEPCRSKALGIIRELILSPGGDEDMACLLGTVHSAPADALLLKTHVLKSLVGCLRESHRTRTVFRKVGGFVYVTSVLISLEGKLRPNESLNKDVLTLLHVVFYTISIAMRFEPANAKFFYQEICMTNLSDTIRLLGCFSRNIYLQSITDPVDPQYYDALHNIFTGNLLEVSIPAEIPSVVAHACIVLRLLYDITLDSFDKPTFCGSLSVRSPNLARQNTNEQRGRLGSGSRSSMSPLNLSPPAPEPLIVHSGALLCFARLLPGLPRTQSGPSLAVLLDYFAHVMKSLVRSERNQQVMCDAGLTCIILEIAKSALQDEQHCIHAPLQYTLERLAAQSLEPKDLREFLRMGNPLYCISPEQGSPCKPCGPVPLTRIKTLVSMTTPRDYRSQGSCTLPPFVEFDMSAEGFGCLYLPSIAPQSANLNALTPQDSAITGGIGSGDRVFPPQTGLTYCTWICVDKFSDPRTDPHCVRLITLVRSLNNARDEHLVCLAVVLSARDKAIIISTHETLVPHNVGEWEPEGTGECGARVWCPDLLQEGQWHHITLILNRAVLKNSSFSLYLDGQHMHSGKMHYISVNPGGGAATLSSAASVYGIIGTPPPWRRYSRLIWRQGPAVLVEEVLSPSTVTIIYQLGPHYVGSYQAAQLSGPNQEPMPPLVSEEKVMFGLNARAMTQLTLFKIRKVYSKNDNKAIAKQLGMSSHENATPIRILHNSAGHLSGPARCLGGTVVGYLGVRVFCPKPAAIMVDSVGGCSVLLGLIAMAQDVECLYAGVKALVCVVKSNKAAQAEMDRRKGYQTLAMLLKRKRQLLNSHILHLIFGLVGTVDSQKETSSIPNLTAFQDLICELEVWLGSPCALIKQLLEHLLELATEAAHRLQNLRTMRELQLVTKLLYIIPEIKNTGTKQVLLQLLGALLGGQPRPNDLLSFGQYISSTLPPANQPEKDLILVDRDGDGLDTESELVLLRNKCLQLLHSLLFANRSSVNTIVSEEVSRVLGMDWLLGFMQSQIHSSTVIWAMRLLVILCSGQGAPSILLQRFRDGQGNGGWLRNTDLVSHSQQVGVVLGGCVNSTENVKTELLHIQGFQMLDWLIPTHLEVSELYFLLIGLMLGQPVRHIPSETRLAMDTVWPFLWGVTVGGQNAPTKQSMAAVASKISLCSEAIIILLSMVRQLIHRDQSSLPGWIKDHPVTIVQVLFSLYHNLPDFPHIVMTADVLTALASTLFAPGTADDIQTVIAESGESSGASTPSSDHETPVIVNALYDVKENIHLTEHSARKFVMDFLRVIVIDSLPLSVTSKQAPIIDLVLDASPSDSTNSQQVEYQTEVLTTLMEHLLSSDQFSNESNVSNVCYLSARLVDKLWQGHLSRDPHEAFKNAVLLANEIIFKWREFEARCGNTPVTECSPMGLAVGPGQRRVDKVVFDFTVKLIAQAKKKSVISLEGLHHCLNRTILFLLSRSTDSIADQMSVLEALHKLTTNRLLIFGAGNHELEFIGCLTYCLLQLSADMKIILDSHMRTTWHVNPSSDLESCDDRLTQHQGRNLMAGAARRVWEELYVCKKPAIEEAFKVTLALPSPNAKAPDLSIIREQLSESATKLWLHYIDSERKASYRVPWELHNQIQSKIQKVTGGLTRLASRTKVKRDDPTRAKVLLGKKQAMCYLDTHLQLVKQLWLLLCSQHTNTTQHTTRYIEEEWAAAWAEMTRERGLWGPEKSNSLDKWMLDSTEGPNRMRRKMTKNDLFYIHYPYRPELDNPENKHLKYKVAHSLDSKEYYRVYQQWRSGCNIGELDRTDNIIDNQVVQSLEDCNGTRDINSYSNQEPNISGSPTDLVNSVVVGRHRTQSSTEGAEDGPEVDDEEEHQSPPPDNQTLLRLLEYHEKITHMFRCARIQGLDTTEGLLLFGREHCYVIDGFTLLKNREIRDLDSCPADYEPILPSQGAQKCMQRLCSKFSYEDIREVHKRRYLLQPMALEVFSSDGRNYLLSFPRKVRNKVYQRFTAMATGMSDTAASSVAGQKKGVPVEQPGGLLASLIGDTSVTQRWVRGEISNFQYLMHLNTLAGRSYNDLMQYPVFPWILTDYDSLELDLTNPEIFRDFSRPMGAQSPDRLEQFRKRFKEWDDPHGETPPYHYGTHYSSAMIVCSYLVRMEPFTQHFLRLQGGHFDLADRMFNSVKEAWLSASKHNMADVKELIPEFFYLPEFLCNSNNFDLGFKQSGIALGDVVLPPWAKNDPREFIRVHREALESDYVSHRLHHWIDLIFGYKQHGQPAIESLNVFHHLFYEGNVDIYNIDDPLKKNATIGFINNFGQIPKQLFKKAHPSKKMSPRNSTILDQNIITQSSGSVPPDKLFFHNLDNLRPSLQPIKEVKGPVGQILYTEKAVLAVEQNKVLMPPAYNKYVAWGFADHSLRIGNYDNDKAVFVSETVAQACGEVVACVCPSAKTIVTAGTSTVITVWSYSAIRHRLTVRATLAGHTAAVGCLAAGAAHNVLVSGSRDGSAIVWDLSRCAFVRQLSGHVGPVSAVTVNDLTGDIATCSATWLHVWSINGDALGSVDTCVGRADRMQQILCVAFSQTREWDPLNVIITGSSDGVVRMWSIDYVQVPVDEELAKHPSKLKNVHLEKVKRQDDSTKETNSNDFNAKKKVEDLVKQMSISNETEELLVKSGSDSSLSDGGDTSAKETARRHEEKDTCSDNEYNASPSHDSDNINILSNESKSLDLVIFKNNENQPESIDVANVPEDSTTNDTNELQKQSGVVVLRRKSRGNPLFRKSEGGGSSLGDSSDSGVLPLTTECVLPTSSEDTQAPSQDDSLFSTGGGLRTSKSDTSLTDSFVIVSSPNRKSSDETKKKCASTQNILREGLKWQRQLVFRSKLTMHTAYDRKDNASPASVTCVTAAKNGRGMAVGDTRGRVFRWSVPDSAANRGGPTDHWVRDDTAPTCTQCHVRFSALERRHHCRSCGAVFCSRCSRYEAPVRRLRALRPVRVCQQCHLTLTQRSDEH